MAYAALVSLEQTCNQILNRDRSLITRSQIQLLKSIHHRAAFFQDLLKRCPEKVNDLEGRIRELANTVEDIIEYLFFENNPSVKLSEAELEHQLTKAAEEIESVARDDVLFHEQMKLHEEPHRHARKIYSGAVIVFEDQLQVIIDRLCGESSELQVLPILGTGGIGKTTVARTVYDHQLISEYFHIRVWVTVSQEYSVKSIFSKFLASMKVKGIVAESEEEKIREYLKGGRYLIVLDDMWSEKAWDDVKMLFPDNHNGSRIVLTTRLPDVAAYADPSGPIHEMRFLDEEQSWNLLEERVFGEERCPLELEEIGKKIAASCGGLPLSIVVVAGLLSGIGLDRRLWEQIAENDGKLETLLCLSYAHLPHHLRACFLYLGAFPEDYEISVSELIKLWAAEHFVKPLTYQNLEEMAEEFLADLVDRSLVLVTNRKYYSRFKMRFKSCSLHDMVRDFCIRQAQQEKLLIPVMDYLPSPILRKHFLPRVLKNHRRLSLTSHDLNVKDSTDGSHIRTIICIKQKGYKSVGSVEKFSSLRVLHVLGGDNDWDWEPGQVFNLIHLTYLASHIPTSIVPPTISKLQNLQTLIIYRFDVCLPVEIWRLRQLRHLIAFSFFYPLPSPEGQVLPLEGLQTLSMAKNFVCSETMMKMIPNVKKLGICYLEEKSCEGYHLHNLPYLFRLEKLKLEMCSETSFGASLNYGFPLCLRRLTLSGLRIPWRDMAVVGSLPHLEVLKLRNYACDGDIWETNEGEFCCLQVLLIDESNLREWHTWSDHFPRLRHLSIHRCPYLSEIPYDIGEITTNESIEVDDQNTALLESVKRIKEDQEEYYGNFEFRVHVKRY